MALRFPSDAWARAYMEVINADVDGYGAAARTWTYGAVAIVIEAEPERDVPETRAIVLDLDRGRCRSASLTDPAGAADAPFVITGTYSRWKQVTRGELDPIKSMMQGKLALRGDLPTIVRYVRAAQALIACASRLDVEYPDEDATGG